MLESQRFRKRFADRLWRIQHLRSMLELIEYINFHFHTAAVEEMSTTFALIDDKHVPFARIVWVADVPHFCGNEECTVEGRYEIRIEGDESLFASREERDKTLADMEEWFDPE